MHLAPIAPLLFARARPVAAPPDLPAQECHARTHHRILSSLAPAEQRVPKAGADRPRAFARLPVRELAERAPCEQAHRGALLPQHGLRRAGRLQAQAGWQRERGVPFIHRSVDVDDKTGDVLVKVVDNAVAAFPAIPQRGQHRGAGTCGAGHL